LIHQNLDGFFRNSVIYNILSITVVFLRLISRFTLERTKRIQFIMTRIEDLASRNEDLLIFLKTLLMNPRATGAIVPSSRRLGRTMASLISEPNGSLVVKLGAGTGVTTGAILDRGIAPERLIAVEYCPDLSEQLRRRFPNITVIEGDATQLSSLLNSNGQVVDTIVSGLPLRSFKENVRRKIFSEVYSVISNEGHFIQFTYDFRRNEGYYPSNFSLDESREQWCNLPPAKVDKFIIMKENDCHI